MTDNEYSKARKAAVDALIYWAKTGMREFTMRDAGKRLSGGERC